MMILGAYDIEVVGDPFSIGQDPLLVDFSGTILRISAFWKFQ